MAPNLRDRVRAGVGSFNTWLGEREQDIAKGKTELEATARRFYGGAQQVLTQVAPGARELGGGRKPPPKPPGSAGGSGGSHASITAGGRGASGRSREQQILDNAQRIAAGAQRKAQATAARLGAGYPVRKMAGDAARGVGNLVGLATGPLHAAEDMKDGAVFMGRLLDVTEPYRVPRGEAAWDGVAAAVGGAWDYGKAAIADPREATHQLAESTRATVRGLNPNATAPAATLPAEVRRNFEIGKRQSEAVSEAASWAVGAAELKVAAKVGRMSKAARVAKHIDEGFDPAKAEYLADLYERKGHHAILKERTRLPEFLGGGPLPRWALDNPFNVLKPSGISRGEMYELHSQVDPFFYGTGLPPRLGGGGWSSKRLGIEKYRLPQRIYYGTPGPTKAVVGGSAIIGGGYLNEQLEAEH